MKKICIVTATRAEYGLLNPLIKEFKKQKKFDVRVVVTGTHLLEEFGLTYKEIENDNVKIDEKIKVDFDTSSSSSISKSMGNVMIKFADFFEKSKPDILIVLGDRYEILAIAIAAVNSNIPIAHLYGGETTQGAVDECFRHSITKMSYLHFTSCNQYRNRVIQLGESPDRVYNVGLISRDNYRNINYMTREELSKDLGIKLDKKIVIATFHPVTLEDNTQEKQIIELLEACISYKDINFIFTKSNADKGGSKINEIIDKYANEYDNIYTFFSLGRVRYFSCLKYAEFVIGNSSSGISEVPLFNMPTVNIGDRQKGRIQASSIINCHPNVDDIKKAIDKALDTEFRKDIRDNNYDNTLDSEKSVSKQIVDIITSYLEEDKIDIKKKFYDLGER